MGLYKTAAENLRAARKLITKHWVKGELAVDCNGHKCKPKSVKAVSFCALGAVKRINGPGEKAAKNILITAASTWLRDNKKKRIFNDEDDIFKVNDSFGKEAAIQMFDIAIKLAKKSS